MTSKVLPSASHGGAGRYHKTNHKIMSVKFTKAIHFSEILLFTASSSVGQTSFDWSPDSLVEFCGGESFCSFPQEGKLLPLFSNYCH